MSRLEEARKRTELETAVAALQSANETVQAALQKAGNECEELTKALAEEEQECDDLEKANLELTSENAGLKSDVRGVERLLAQAEKQIKQLQDDKAQMEKLFSEALVNVRTTAETLAKKPLKGYTLKVTGRDGNNDMSSLKIEAE